jgi:hypothetical protein
MYINPIDLLSDGLSSALSRALAGLRFGSVEIVVHEGRVAHIERRERVRLEGADRRSPESRMRNHEDPDRPRRIAGGADSTPDEETRE